MRVGFNQLTPDQWATSNKITEDLQAFSKKMQEHFHFLQEKAGLAMVNRKLPNEFDDEEIAGCAAKITSPYDSMFSPTTEPRVSITMDENGYTIAKTQPPGSINASFVWVTFAQLDEVEKRLPDFGYLKVDGEWQRA